MKDKDALILESLYNKVVEEAKTKSKKQVGYLLSNKVSPLTSKQKKKLKKELHSGEVKVESSRYSGYGIGGSGEEKDLEFEWQDHEGVLKGHWYIKYDYQAHGKHSYGDYDNPPSSEINIEITYLEVIKFNDEDQTEHVVYKGSPHDLTQMKNSNPELYEIVSTFRSLAREHEEENDDNYQEQ
jgi:hypothetical protein